MYSTVQYIERRRLRASASKIVKPGRYLRFNDPTAAAQVFRGGGGGPLILNYA